MMKNILTISLIFIFGLSATAQFETCNSNTTKTLNDVYFINENIGIAVGAGVILRSVDGGLNWNTIIEIEAIDFTKVKFWDDLHGVSMGTKIYITEDAGISWNELVTPNNGFHDVEILSNTTAILSGYPEKIIKLNSFGASYEILIGDTFDYNIGHMSFVDDNIGFAHHFEGSVVTSMLKTIDGGHSWENTSIASDEEITIIEDIKFVSENIGFRGGWYNPHLMKTIDGGLNWFQTENKDPAANTYWSSIYDFHMEENQTNSYYACGWYGDIFKSFDEGNNWEKIETGLATNIALRGIYFVDDFKGWVVGDNGTILRTINGGGTTSNQHLNQIEFNFFPNPFMNEILIDNFGNLDIEKIYIYNSIGILIKEIQPTAILNLEDLISGMYILTIKFPKSEVSRKIIKI